MIPPHVYQEMHDELDSVQPYIALAPAPDPRHDGHCVRVAFERNPAWYRELCARFPSSRRSNPGGKRTKVKRRSILTLLARLAAGENVESIYRRPLEDLASQRGPF